MIAASGDASGDIEIKILRQCLGDVELQGRAAENRARWQQAMDGRVRYQDQGRVYRPEDLIGLIFNTDLFHSNHAQTTEWDNLSSFTRGIATYAAITLVFDCSKVLQDTAALIANARERALIECH